ncbi:MAG TPA: rod shape-determining protein MreC [Rhodothermales bacterium]|nr:rod shape-determining protein MreC [Rhodothermales bacterium]
MPFRLWDQIRDWVIVTLLLIISLGTMLTQNTAMLRGLRGFALETSSWAESQFAWVGQFSRAVSENETLRAENIAYSSELARSREARLENERLRALIAFRDSSDYPMVPARIVSKDFLPEKNFITLDVGRDDSVDVGMAVIDEQGVIGKVVFTSPNYSRVMPYQNTDFRLPAKVLPSQASGIIRWPGTRSGELMLEYIVKTEAVEVGEQVVTSGYSGVFPPGIPVGTITSLTGLPGRNELEIRLQPATNLGQAEHAFVILRKPDPQRLELESRELR